jgi:hypothetical protein
MRLVLLISLVLLLFAGCYHQEQSPEITYLPPSSPQVIYKPPVTTPTMPEVKVNGTVPANWVPPGRIEKNWTAIVIHHSDTTRGNAAIFDKEHREVRGWDGVGYDFVIGNGAGSGDGQVEVTFRWTQQRVGAHCKTPNNWANEEAVGICLVGDFNSTLPTNAQISSLRKLVEFLQKRYTIPKTRIYGHGTTPGAHVTDCPGKRFPLNKFRSSLTY